MENQEFVARLTFFYLDGQQESYVIVEMAADGGEANWAALQQQIRDRLQGPWCLLQLAEETVTINMANVLKVEINPTLEELQGEGLFANVQRETALTRSYNR